MPVLALPLAAISQPDHAWLVLKVASLALFLLGCAARTEPTVGGHRFLPLVPRKRAVPESEAKPWDWFGRSVCVLGDLDGDGSPELAASNPFGSQEVGEVWVFSGLDGTVHRRFTGDTGFGSALFLAGDVDADGVDDLLVLSTPGRWSYWLALEEGSPVVSVHSVRTGETLFSEVAASAGAVGDLDADGHDDVLCGSRVLSGRDWSVLLELPATERREFSVVGDVDGDGCVDVASAGEQVVELYASDGRRLWSFYPQWSRGRPGFSWVKLRGRADLDADGCDDLLVTLEENWLGPSGRLWAISGSDGAVLYVFDTGADGNCDLLRQDLAVIGDVDGDGATDFAVGNDYNERVAVYSGRSGALLYHVAGAEDPLHGTYSVAPLPDLDGDGVADFVVGHVGNWCARATRRGEVELYSGREGHSIRRWCRADLVEDGER